MLRSQAREIIMKVLFIGYVWPEPTSSAAGVRSWNIIHSLMAAQTQITFASPSQVNSFTDSLSRKGIHTVTIQANDPSFDAFIKELDPQIVIFDRFVMEEQFGWRVQENCPNALRLLDTQDLHFLRRSRQKALESKEEPQLITEDTYREIASIYRCDLTLMISDYEYKLLTSQFNIPSDLLLLQRLSYSAPKSPRSFHERDHFMMIGNFRHPPNRDGVLWFRDQIWPIIRKKLPQAEVHFYGAYPPKEMMSLTQKSSGLIVKGATPDQYLTLSQYRVNLAPLRFGAGIKGKISDGWWTGTPVVTTSIGAEGMYEGLPFGGIIADRPEDFANAAVQLYSDPNEWEQCQFRGQKIIHQLYSESTNLMQRIHCIQSQLSTHRKNNFIGTLLSFHSMRSTKYFSKWIEEKSKRLSSQESHD